MDGKGYPKEFIRGISSKDFIQNGYVLASAFQFEDQGRDDKKSEASINWVDDDGAITVALLQRKDSGKLQFPAGVAKLDLEKVKLILKSFSEEEFSYERAPIEGNQYHGNLLMKSTINKPVKQLITNGLALAAGTSIIPQSICE
ncbi:MAG: hypothetical protein IJR95_01670 [Lachnospiraceae bacterium]|nr:hypothetical protein [Lachnospiraceae bacterium]